MNERATIELTDSNIAAISDMVYKTSGLDIELNKKELVISRLSQRLSDLDIDDFNGYLRYIKSDISGKEVNLMAEMLTTNYTLFFREMQHFEFINNNMIELIKERKGRFRIWCAGCSTGEEPYSIAMFLNDILGPGYMSNVRILATDISEKVLKTAMTGIYGDLATKSVPDKFLSKYFRAVSANIHTGYEISNEIRRNVSFARLNLIENWSMEGSFDLILCRNVMIYFDKFTKEKLTKRFYDMLRLNGYFFTGHSESLTTLNHNFKYVRPAVYQKVF